MKKLSVLLLSFIMLFSLGGCKKSKIDDDALATLKDISSAGVETYKSISIDAKLDVDNVQDGEAQNANIIFDADIINDQKDFKKIQAAINLKLGGAELTEEQTKLMKMAIYIKDNNMYMDMLGQKMKMSMDGLVAKQDTEAKSPVKPMTDEQIEKFKELLSEASIETTENGNKKVKFVFDNEKLFEGMEKILGEGSEDPLVKQKMAETKKEWDELKETTTFESIILSYEITKDNAFVSLNLDCKTAEKANPKNTSTIKLDIKVSNLNSLKEVEFPDFKDFKESKAPKVPTAV
ncbi:MAG: hypothetical protein RR516_04540 [Erysipelotrichaceae bacterium]